jgi:hypothetical protein
MFGLVFGLMFGLLFGLGFALVRGLYLPLGSGLLGALYIGLVVGLPFALVSGLLQTRSLLITSRTPKEARSRSLIAALTWLALGLFLGLILFGPFGLIFFGLFWGLGVGLVLALRNGGWFVLLQKVALRRLARAGNLPSPPYDFLEWGIETQIFRRVGGGVRFRHNLIQQHLANTSEGV